MALLLDATGQLLDGLLGALLPLQAQGVLGSDAFRMEWPDAALQKKVLSLDPTVNPTVVILAENGKTLPMPAGGTSGKDVQGPTQPDGTATLLREVERLQTQVHIVIQAAGERGKTIRGLTAQAVIRALGGESPGAARTLALPDQIRDTPGAPLVTDPALTVYHLTAQLTFTGQQDDDREAPRLLFSRHLLYLATHSQYDARTATVVRSVGFSLVLH